MLAGKFNVIIDQAWGSSGKGKISTYLADKYGVTNVSSANLPNAGHSAVFRDGTKFVAKAIPTAMILRRVNGLGMTGFISPGSGFSPKQLLKEWYECGKPNLFIHDRALFVTEEHAARERDGSDSTKHIASTMQGSGTALSDKILRKTNSPVVSRTPLLDVFQPLLESDPDLTKILGGQGLSEALEKIQIVPAMEFRNMTHGLIEAGNTWLHEGSQGYALSVDHGSHYPNCLSGDSRVVMADGKTLKIKDMQVGDVVLSKDDLGRIVQKRVINTWKKSTNNKKWFNIITETSVYNSHDQQWIGPKLTEEHKVQTQRGKVAVQDLNRGDQVFVNEYELTEDGLQVFLGSLLGDGTVPACKKNKLRATFQITHGMKQRGYALAKAAIMQSYIGGSIRFLRYGSSSFKEGNECIRYQSKSSLIVKRLATRLGCYGAKDPNITEIINLIDERGLAVWFQDDGRRKDATNGQEVFLYTNGFSLSCVEALAARLESKFGLHFSVYMQKGEKRKGHGDKEYPTLRLSRKDHKKWFSMISQYVHPDLQYKLPNDVQAGWTQGWNRPGRLICASETVLDIVRSRDFRGMEMCYDIEVEDTHNFFVRNDKGSFNVENCTSRNCTLQAAMDYMAVPPSMLGDVWLNLRSYPIRVGHVIENGEQKGDSGGFYPDCEELTWEQVARRSGMPAEEAAQLAERERTTVTKRVRRVSTFSWVGLKDAVRVNGITKISVNFVQYLNWADNGIRGGKEALDKLSRESREFISRVEEISGVPVVLIGTGALHDEIIDLS